MKKTYINPEMEIVEIKMQALLTGSLPLIDDETVDTGDVLAPELGEDLVVFGEDELFRGARHAVAVFS